jgi:glycosyltransferase involved in cell wall biosynthesis
VHLRGEILIVSSEFYPMPAAGASRVIPMVSVLESFCDRISVLTSNDAKENINVERSFFSVPSNKSKLPFRLLQELLLGIDLGIRIFLKRDVRLCIITSPPFFMASCCALFAKLSGKKYVFDVRDRYPRVLEDLGVLKLTGFLGKILKDIESWVYRGASQVTTVTNGLLTELRNDFPDTCFNLLRNGFDEEVFGEEVLNVSKNQSFTVVHHGRLGRFYDLQLFTQVIKSVEELDPEIKFLLIGDFPPELLNLRAGNLKILPMMELEDLSRNLVKCHIGICLLKNLPAMKNAFPAKSYDFIGAGLPQIIGPSGEFCDLISKHGAGIVLKDINPLEIAQEIVNLKNDNQRFFEMSDNVSNIRKFFGRREIVKSFFQSIKSEI